jgi:tRNA 2-selenouridine synthase
MALKITSLKDLSGHGFDTVIDVRSPAEHAEDHIPGAINLPVLDDEERARVGTIYTRVSPFTARKIGAALVARNAARHLEGPLADKPGGWRPLVYCWRGGQRSNSFATILAQVGWRVEVIEGGYRSYRRLVAEAMHERPLPHRLILLDGNTGTAKTELLALAAERGVQAVDLEGLARHRGSLFGAVAAPQPSQKAFEGALARAFEALDPARPVLVEAESSKIGDLLVPPSVWEAMKRAPRIRIDAPLSERAAYLTRAYSDIVADGERLRRVIGALIPFQGRERVAHWLKLAERGEVQALAAELMARHYDPRYARWRGRGKAAVLAELQADSLSPEGLAALADRLAEVVGRAEAAEQLPEGEGG